jgi:hypothetical protein
VSRTIQKPGDRGSLKWIQRAVNSSPQTIDEPILAAIDASGEKVEWLSPLASDDYAEYRDGDFLNLLGQGDLREELLSFWPQRGPQWDALGRTSRGDIILVEAKAHIAEMLSPPSQAALQSRAIIDRALATTIAALEKKPNLLNRRILER